MGKNRKDSEKGQTRLSHLNQDMQTRDKAAGLQIREVDTVEYQEKVDKVYRYLKEGMASNEIYAMMCVEDEQMTPTKFTTLCNLAYQHGEIQLHKDRDYVFQLHMQRYEDMWQKASNMADGWGRELDTESGPKSKDWATIAAKCVHAMSALKGKEDLLGLHDKKLVLEMTDQKATIVDLKESERAGIPGYDMDKLSLPEKIELLELLKKSRTVPIEGIQRVTIKTLKVEVNPETGNTNRQMVTKNIDNVEDIEFEEMPADVVSRMPKIEKKKKPKMMKSPLVEDSTGLSKKDKKNIKTADQVHGKVRLSAIEQFKQKMQIVRGKKK